jgi:hypothetical protein
MECDYIIMQNKHPKLNSNYKNILACLDLWSRRAFLIPTRSREAVETRNALKKIFEQSGVFKNLHTDREASFYSAPVQRLLKDLGTNHFSTYSEIKVRNKKHLVIVYF